MALVGQWERGLKILLNPFLHLKCINAEDDAGESTSILRKPLVPCLFMV